MGANLEGEGKGSCSVVSDPQRPHGLQPSRRLHPWDFPGKSTGVGCHCLLRIWKEKQLWIKSPVKRVSWGVWGLKQWGALGTPFSLSFLPSFCFCCAHSWLNSAGPQKVKENISASPGSGKGDGTREANRISLTLVVLLNSFFLVSLGWLCSLLFFLPLIFKNVSIECSVHCFTFFFLITKIIKLCSI